MTYDPLDPQRDPFRPPEVPTEVSCLHCGKQYDSYLIEWRVETDAAGKPHGFWCCPTPGCGGMGFGFDIFPTDPAYRDERGGWVGDDEDDESEDDGFDEEDFDGEDDFSDAADSDRPFGPRRSPNGNGESDTPGPDDEVPF
jgi:hypothetical protein